MGRLALRRRTSGLWAAAGIIAKTKRSGTRIILRSEFILPELCIGRGFPLVVAQRLPITAVSRYSDTGADFLCWRLIGPAKSAYGKLRGAVRAILPTNPFGGVLWSAARGRRGRAGTLHCTSRMPTAGGRWRENSCSDSFLTVGLYAWARLMVSRTRSRKPQCHSYCRRRFASTAPSIRRGGSSRPAGVDAHASTTRIWLPSAAAR